MKIEAEPPTNKSPVKVLLVVLAPAQLVIRQRLRGRGVAQQLRGGRTVNAIESKLAWLEDPQPRKHVQCNRIQRQARLAGEPSPCN